MAWRRRSGVQGYRYRYVYVAWLAPALLAMPAAAAAVPGRQRAEARQAGEAREGGQASQPVVVRQSAEAPQAAEARHPVEAPPPGAAQPSVSLPPDLQRLLADYETAWRARDAAALASLFAEDGFVLPGGHPPVRGRAAIHQFYAKAGGPLSLRALAYATEGTVGYIIGAYARQAGGEDVGKFTLTLRKQPGGRWQVMSDMDNPNRRP
jgi:ketosteroid isomerase-like protein